MGQRQFRLLDGDVDLVILDGGRSPEALGQIVEHAASGGVDLRLLVVVERYPDLKATGNFQTLQAQLEGTENRISVERGRFNDAVRAYDTAVKSFPAVLYAGLFGFHEKPYFTATAGAEAPPKVQFDFGKQGSSTAPAAEKQ